MLIGREYEQQTIERLLAGARVGRSGALLLVGEAGIGKTSLVEHSVAAATGMRILRASGVESEQHVPFAGLHQLLSSILATTAGLPGPHRETLSVALGLQPGHVAGPFDVGVALLGLLSRLAEEEPSLLAVDDAHLWDRSSSAALAFAGRRLIVDRIALLVSSRPADTPLLDAGLETLSIQGLDADAVRGLLLSRDAGAAATDELADRLHAATLGNPLAVTELVGDIEDLLRVSPESPLPVPEALGRSYLRRVRALDPVTQDMLLVAAVANGDLGVTSRAASALGIRRTGFQTAEEAGLVHLGPGTVRFQHPLVRAALYGAAAPEARRRAHRAVARTLPAGDVERRAWHLAEATVGIDDEVADLLHAVGERCLTRGAHAVSATAFERAALSTSREGRAAQRFLAAGRAAWLAGQVSRSEELLARASRLALAPGLRAEIDGLRGDIALRTGSVLRARDVLVAAAEHLGPTDPDAAVTLLGDAVTACHYLADGRAALGVVDLIDGALPRCRTSRARILGDLGAGIGQVLAGHPGGPDRIRRAVDAVQAVAEVGDQMRPAWTVLGPLFLRESGRGRDLAEQAATALRRRCALVTLPTLLFHVARHDATTDRWEQSVTEYAEGITLARETGQTTDLALCLAGLAWVRARTGREEAARRDAAEATTLATRHHIHLARICAAFAIGELELALGRPDAAATELQSLCGFLTGIGFQDVDFSPEPELAEALHHLGRAEEAIAMARDFHARARVKSQPWSLARAERAMALGEGPGAETRFRTALDLHAATRDGFELARTELALGAALRRERRRVDARAPLRSALATFNRLGARPWAETAALELAATGETPLRAGDDELDQLTSQELQIARLLGEGRTTREAAGALFLSPKTVEYHLRHVYTKLGIRSRAELAERLQVTSGS